MLRVKFTEASRFQNSLLTQNIDLPIKKKRIIVGRGEQLQQQLNKDTQIIDLSHFDTTLSRIHASFNFSPAWFRNATHFNYLSYLKYEQESLPAEIQQKICLFLKPQKTCILKDMKSTIGIFRKINDKIIEPDMIIEFVHHSNIKFHHYEQYSTFEELQFHINLYRQTNSQIIVLGDINKVKKQYQIAQTQIQKLEILRIWRLTVKQTNYILLIEQKLILRIGRSSHCQIQIKDSAISRYQAYLKCENKKWNIIDGNQIQKSKNGTWMKCKNIYIPVSENQKNIKKQQVKIGTIKCQIQLIQKFQWLNLNKMLNGDISKSFIKLGIEDDHQQIHIQ